MIFFWISFVSLYCHAVSFRKDWHVEVDKDKYSFLMDDDAGSNLLAFSESSNSVYVTGAVNQYSIDGQEFLGYSNPFLMKYSTNGSRIWTKYWGSGDENNGDKALAVAVDPTKDEIYVTGGASASLPNSNFTFQAQQGRFNSFLTKFDGEGNILWTKMWGGKFFL